MRQLLVQCVVFLGIGLLVPVWAETQVGLEWLASQAQSDGSYATYTDVATPVQATSETLRTLHVLDELAHPSILPARLFLATEPFRNTEYLARMMLAQAEADEPTTELVRELLTYQNPDGGFGDLPGYPSTVLDTAFALEALAAAGHGNTADTGPAVGFLLAQQDPDGSWADGGNGVLSVSLIARPTGAVGAPAGVRSDHRARCGPGVPSGAAYRQCLGRTVRNRSGAPRHPAAAP